MNDNDHQTRTTTSGRLDCLHQLLNTQQQLDMAGPGVWGGGRPVFVVRGRRQETHPRCQFRRESSDG